MNSQWDVCLRKEIGFWMDLPTDVMIEYDSEAYEVGCTQNVCDFIGMEDE